MICYKDMTFCALWQDCEVGHMCERALTPEVLEAADKWWGSKGAPIVVMLDAPPCFVGKEDNNDGQGEEASPAS